LELLDLIRSLASKLTEEGLAKAIDHTMLRPGATYEDLERACREAAERGFAACYVSPWFVRRASELLEGSGVKVGSVVSFPHGNSPIDVKVREASLLIEMGADEVDMVANLGAIRGHAWEYLREEVSRVAEVVHDAGCVLKVIIETGLLSDEEKAKAAEVVAEAGGDYVKTCTGFVGRGVTVHDVLVLRRALRGGAKIKASGGIRHAADALLLIAAGADRIGTSAGIAIHDEFKRLSELLA